MRNIFTIQLTNERLRELVFFLAVFLVIIIPKGGFKIAGIEFSPIYFVQKNWGGLYKSDNQYLYVNRGLGTIGFSGRVEMKPEITLLTLHRTKTH